MNVKESESMAGRKKNKVLLFFTGSYPYGRQEAFIENEIGYLANTFDKVVVLPQTTAPTSRALPDNCEVLPLPEFFGLKKWFAIALGSLTSFLFWKCLGEVFQGKDPLYRLRTLASYVGLARAYRNAIVKNVFPSLEDGAEIFLYSYWLDRNALAMVMLRDCHKACNVVSRVHAFDVYEERNPDSYLPLRKVILHGVKAVHAISQDAADYLSERYPGLSLYVVSRLGTTRGSWLQLRSVEGALHLVSVSNVIPLKRVAMIAKSVHLFAERRSGFRIKWTHFGDGPLFEDLKRLVADFDAPNLEVDLRGGQLNSVIKEFYGNNPVDLFINLSESEGIPVSFMEAMSYAIPVMATNVGGVGEILDSSCGYLLTSGVSAEQVADRLCEIFDDRELLNATASQALKVWTERYSADVTYPDFCGDLLGQAR